MTPLNTLILSGGALTGALNSTALQISGTSAVLTGTVNSLGGQQAANAITFSGAVGAGPYTMNGFAIQAAAAVSLSSSAQSSASTSAQQKAVTIPPAIMNTQVYQTLLGMASPSSSFHISAGSSTPGEALSQEMLTESLESNLFGNSFQLMVQSEELKMARNPELDVFVNFWLPPDDEDLWFSRPFLLGRQEAESEPEDFQALQDR